MSASLTSSDGLYVWGYNGRNELGLQDDTIAESKQDYVKGSMTKPINNPMFNNITYQVAAGNVSSLFLCANSETKETFLVTCGVTFVLNEGCETEQNEFTSEEVEKMLE